MIDLLKKKYRNIRKSVFHYRNLLFGRSPKLLILLYHRILPETGFNPFNTIVSSETFIRHVEFIKTRYPVISMKEALERCVSGNIKNNIQVVFTFDDGYVDNYKTVFPALKERNIPALFLLTTDYVGKGPLADWKEICDKMGVVYDEKDRCVTWKEAKEMAENGMEIGSHAVSHRSLTSLSITEAGGEITKSKDEIEKNIGRECMHFAFPFGSAKDYNQDLIGKVKKSGYKSCLLNIHGYNHPNKDRFVFKRIIMDECTNLNHLLG